MGRPIRPSTVRVCQFRHPGVKTNLSYNTILIRIRQQVTGFFRGEYADFVLREGIP